VQSNLNDFGRIVGHRKSGEDALTEVENMPEQKKFACMNKELVGIDGACVVN